MHRLRTQPELHAVIEEASTIYGNKLLYHVYCMATGKSHSLLYLNISARYKHNRCYMIGAIMLSTTCLNLVSILMFEKKLKHMATISFTNSLNYTRTLTDTYLISILTHLNGSNKLFTHGPIELHYIRISSGPHVLDDLNTRINMH